MNSREYFKLLIRLSQIVDEGVHIVGRDGKSIVYNKAMSEIENIEPREVLGKPFRDVFSDIPEEESTLLRALKGSATEQTQQTYRNKYGKEITTVNATVPVIVGGEVIAAIEISKDITHIKDMSETILELRKGTIAKGRSYRAKDGEEKKPGTARYTFDDLIGESEEFKRLIDLTRRAAASPASVLISGETGTGKELFAQSIHSGSERREKPFLAQNCAALPETLLEGILFGTSRGGFTGAVDRAGLFEQANGGTLLLDEISAMPYELQSKLLRVLQEAYIRRVGGSRDIPVDVRIIATINEPASELIASGRLRKDLYYRLAIINLELPPLRSRKSDIALLGRYFLEKYNRLYGKELWMISDEAVEKLKSCDYPGNVRELENMIMAAVSLAGKEHVLSADMLEIRDGESEKGGNPPVRFDPAGGSLDEYMEELEREIIKRSFDENGGNVSRTCKSLGIKRQTLQYKLRKYGIGEK